MRSDARANREALVAAASKHIASQGADFSLTAVAADAGVGIATLYRKFPTRSDLIAAVLSEMFERMTAIVERATDRMDTDPVSGWGEFVREIAGLRPGALMPAFASIFVAEGRVPNSIERLRGQSFAAVNGILERAQAAGLISPDITAPQFQMGIASITRPLPDVAAPNLMAHEAWLIEVYIKGLRPRA